MKKLIILALVAMTAVGCSDKLNYKHVYKVSYISPKVSTVITNYYTFRKGQDFHNREWIKQDFIKGNPEHISYWDIDTLWIDSLGLIPWENYNQ